MFAQKDMGETIVGSRTQRMVINQKQLRLMKEQSPSNAARFTRYAHKSDWAFANPI